jgi:hypothetical protein
MFRKDSHKNILKKSKINIGIDVKKYVIQCGYRRRQCYIVCCINLVSTVHSDT